mgnify:CR=1 FL=1
MYVNCQRRSYELDKNRAFVGNASDPVCRPRLYNIAKCRSTHRVIVVEQGCVLCGSSAGWCLSSSGEVLFDKVGAPPEAASSKLSIFRYRGAKDLLVQ